MKWELAIVALSVLGVASVSSRLTGTSVTPAMAFVAIGVLLGPLVANDVTLPPTGATIRTLAETTLALVLFSDASRVKVRQLRLEYAVPLRLLAIGLPLTIGLGAVIGPLVLKQLTLAEALVLAVVLAPTDAALGQAVVTEPRLPSRIRQGLNIESGLNDGICVPLLLVALAVADASSEGTPHVTKVLAEELGYGVIGGVAGGLVASAAVTVSRHRGLITGSWLQAVPVAATGLAYGTAVALGGSGFIASFLAGILFGALGGEEADSSGRLIEELGDIAAGVTLLAFGAVLLGPALEHLSWPLVLYAGLSLTLVRMLPVAVAMLGSGARWPTVGFLGWFGPRGLASIVFAAIVVQESHVPGGMTIVRTAYLTVGASVFLHGISAAPLAARYARWYASHPHGRQPAMESVPTPAHRIRGAPAPRSP